MKTEATTAQFIDVFAALADANRQALLLKLDASQSRSITELAGDLPLTRQGVTKHLRALERAGLARSARSGRETRFLAEPGALREAAGYLERISGQWDQALERLRQHVEDQ
ncbi:MAG: helix-turn-helix domain-containing protein [Pseudomonadota bacterium]